MTPSAAPGPWPAWQGEPERLATGGGAQLLPAALAWLEGLGERWGLAPRTVFALTLCADEVLANLASHARKADGAAAQVGLACGRVSEGLGLWIGDDGPAFDPTQQASAQLAASVDEAVPGGHGLRFLRHYTRAMHYRRVSGRNELLLVFP